MDNVCTNAHEMRRGDCLEAMRDMEPDSIDAAGVACVHERFGFLGIEQDEEYCWIARQRIVSQYDEGELPYGGDDAG